MTNEQVLIIAVIVVIVVFRIAMEVLFITVKLIVKTVIHLINKHKSKSK
jgi:hypothetical protein